MSGAPLCNLFETCREVNSHHSELSLVSDPLDIDYMGIGFLPKWDLDDIETVPKARYKIMKNYMTKKGKHGLDMMHRTTTIQANYRALKNVDLIKPCLKRYLAGYVKSKFRKVEADEFVVATLLPVQQFKKRGDKYVFNKSRGYV